jgi:hypothetical protein
MSVIAVHVAMRSVHPPMLTERRARAARKMVDADDMTARGGVGGRRDERCGKYPDISIKGGTIGAGCERFLCRTADPDTIWRVQQTAKYDDT